MKYAVPVKRAYTAPVQKMARKAKAINENFKKRVRRAVGSRTERRYVVWDTISSYSDSGNIVPIAFGIVEGSSPYGTRDGDKIVPYALKMKYSWQYADENNMVRLLIYQWKSDNNVNAPSVLNEFVDISSQGTQNFPLTQNWFLGNKNASLVYDSGAMHVDQYNPILTRNVNIFGKKLQKMQFSTGSSGWNQFYLVAMSDSALATHPQLRFQCQLEYIA